MRRRSDLALARLWFAARVRLILRSPRGPTTSPRNTMPISPTNTVM